MAHRVHYRFNLDYGTMALEASMAKFTSRYIPRKARIWLTSRKDLESRSVGVIAHVVIFVRTD